MQQKHPKKIWCADKDEPEERAVKGWAKKESGKATKQNSQMENSEHEFGLVFDS